MKIAFSRAVVPALALVFASAFVTSVSFADEGPHYCESGDPGGGGPSANIEKTGADYKISISYNRRNLDSSSRSAYFKYNGPPIAVVAVKEQGADCIQSTFKTPRSKIVVDFIW